MALAQLYKMTLYICDLEENLSINEIKCLIKDNALDGISISCVTHFADEKVGAKVEWDDDIDINNIDSTTEQWEKYFEEGNERILCDNMDKPKICEVLGVEPGESFYIKGFGDVEFWIMDDGTFSTSPLNVSGSTSALLRTLDYPERIIRKPRFTEQEAERAKAIRVLFPECKVVSQGVLGVRLDVVNPVIDADWFPSLKDGEVVTLDEIIEGYNNG